MTCYIEFSTWITSEYVISPVSCFLPHWALPNVLLNFPHITFFKFSTHCWFQFTWFGCQWRYLVWFTLLIVILCLNINPIIRNILEIIPCAVQTDVYSSVHFGWHVLHISVWSTGSYCCLGSVFPWQSYLLLELFEYLLRDIYSWTIILAHVLQFFHLC